jgi:hypothetical protein
MVLMAAVIKSILGETTPKLRLEPVDFRLRPEYFFGD